MSGDLVATARQALEAWNRHDADWVVERATPDMEFVPAVAATVDGESIRGREEVVRFRNAMDETWEAFRLEADEFRQVGDRVLMVGRVIAKGRGSGVELDQPMSSVFWFRDGKIARMQSFLDEDAAREAAEHGAVA